ncbi:FAD-dependent oxidoreductase [Jannaschia pagri]|uniref:FAD-dependent oxidoreductase n=1 Tax=Jannaschia pagri TaxID=2829797 RepID=UPI001C7D35D8|nr:FAD-dependent oxidoreductase [Jannaschia sp. AI_62]
MAEAKNWDVCVYGSTPGGIIAAISAARLGRSVILLEPTTHFGGTITSGLNATDTVAQSLIRGIVREFFERCTAHYSADMTDETGFVWRPEARVANVVLRDMISEAGVTVRLDTPILRLAQEHNRLRHAELSSQERLQAAHFIDATYEGDLLPLAKVPYAVGRESKDTYGEPWAGRGVWKRMLPWHSKPVDGLDGNGRPLPMVEAFDPNIIPGQEDSQPQSYCHRLTLTNDPNNRREIPQPDSYDPEQFEVFRRLISAGGGRGDSKIKKHFGTWRSGYFNLSALPFSKYDMNSGPLVPTNSPHFTKGWIKGDAADRKKMLHAWEQFTLGVLHFIRTDSKVAPNVQAFFNQFGFCRDEYQNNEGLPPSIYVREGRRLLGDRVLTQNDVEAQWTDHDQTLGNAKYHLDCKPVRWSVDKSGIMVREGMFFSEEPYQFHIPYWLILPKSGTVENLSAVCAPSCSHVAFGSVRMEPTFMTLGAAAGTAACLAITAQSGLHAISPATIRETMRSLPRRLGREREQDYIATTGRFEDYTFTIPAQDVAQRADAQMLQLLPERPEARADARLNTCTAFTTHLKLTGWAADPDAADYMAWALYVEYEDGRVFRIEDRRFRPDVEAALKGPRAKYGFVTRVPLGRPSKLWVVHATGRKSIPIPSRKLKSIEQHHGALAS